MSDTLLGPGYDMWKVGGPSTDRLADARGDWAHDNDDDLEALHSLLQRAAEIMKRVVDPKADAISDDQAGFMEDFCEEIPHFKDIFESYPREDE